MGFAASFGAAELAAARVQHAGGLGTRAPLCAHALHHPLVGYGASADYRMAASLEAIHRWLPGPCGPGASCAQQFARPRGAHSTLAGRQIDDGTFAVVEPGT